MPNVLLGQDWCLNLKEFRQFRNCKKLEKKSIMPLKSCLLQICQWLCRKRKRKWKINWLELKRVLTHSQRKQSTLLCDFIILIITINTTDYKLIKRNQYVKLGRKSSTSKNINSRVRNAPSFIQRMLKILSVSWIPRSNDIRTAELHK